MALLSRRTLAALGFVAAGAAAPLAAQNPTPPSVSVGGVIYAQWGAQLDSLSPANNFDITRAYVNAIGKFNGGIMTRVTLDVYHDADATAGGALLYRLKYAYAGWTPSGSPFTFRFGLTQTPFIDWEEALWDYRMQGPVPVDRNSYMSSSDFGLAVDGSFNSEQFNFQAMAMNGENYNKTPGDQHKDFAARASFRLLPSDEGSRVGGLRITGYAQVGTPTSGGTRNRFIGLVSYRSKSLLLAGEFAATKDTVTNPAKISTTGSILSAYGWYRLPATPVAVVARVDIADPNTCSPATPPVASCPAGAAFDKRTTIIGGLSYQLSQNVRLLADIDRTSFQTPTGVTAPKAVTQALFQTQFTY
ncbi:MAG TPA: porin [Gemmatimonadales bacterium]|nr:porin [Gemmatimonadales bacterium]